MIGAGGHARVVLDTILSQGSDSPYRVVGVVDPALRVGDDFQGVKVLGKDEDLPTIFKNQATHAFIAVGSIGSSDIRVRIAKRLEEIGFSFPSLVHRSAIVSGNVVLGPGVLVAAGSVLQPGVKIGAHAIINTRTTLDHDVTVGAFSHIAPGSVLSGGVSVGEKVHIGTGSSVIEGRKIGAGALIGAGSVVITDIPENSKAFGNPCRVQEKV